jgi:hypothetical protein
MRAISVPAVCKPVRATNRELKNDCSAVYDSVGFVRLFFGALIVKRAVRGV